MNRRNFLKNVALISGIAVFPSGYLSANKDNEEWATFYHHELTDELSLDDEICDKVERIFKNTLKHHKYSKAKDFKHTVEWCPDLVAYLHTFSAELA